MMQSRHLLFTGAREDALARLPLLPAAPQLELSRDRISLVGPSARLDVAVLLASEDGGETPWLLLQLQFEGITGAERDAISAALRGDIGARHGVDRHRQSVRPDRLH